MNKLIGFFAVFLFGVLPVFAQETEAVKLAEEFFQTFPDKNFEKMQTLWSAKSPERERFLKQFRFSLTDTENISFKDFAIKSSSFEGDKLTLQISLTMDATDAKTKRPKWNFGKWNRVLRLVKENDLWKVWECKFAEEEFAEKLANAKDAAEQDLLLEKNPELVNRFLRRAIVDLSRALRARNELGKTVFLAEMMERLAAKTSDETWLARAWLGIGLNQFLLSENSKALEYFYKSEKLSQKLKDEEGLALVYYALGLLRAVQGEYEQSISYYQKSAELAENLGDKTILARVLNNLGTVTLSQRFGEGRLLASEFITRKPDKLLDELIEHFQKVKRLYAEIENDLGVAFATGNIGQIYYYSGNDEMALRFSNETVNQLENLGAITYLAEGYGSLMLINIAKKNYSEALNNFEKFLRIKDKLPASYDISDIFTLAGKTFRLLGQNEKAESLLSESIKTIEVHRKAVSGDTLSRQKFLSSRVMPYYEMIKLLHSQNRKEEALQFAEMIKARVLFDVVRSGAKFSEKSLTEEEKLQSEKLKNDIENLNRQVIEERLKSKSDEAKLKKLNENLKQARADYEKFQSYLFSIHPEMNLQRGEIPLLQLSEIENLLPDDKTAIIEYAVTDEKILAFVMTRNYPPATAGGSDKAQLEVYQLPITRREIVPKVQNFRRLIVDKNLDYKESAKELYQMLIAPLAKHLKNRDNLIIVPDGVLWELPFQALISAENKHLIEDFAISYAPSLSVLREMSKAKTSTLPMNLLAFGNPFLNNEAIAVGANRNRNLKLEPLPDAEKEILKIGAFYGKSQSNLFIGKKATEEIFKSQAANFRSLHFATHAIADNENPMYSFLVFSQGADGKDDGILEAWEIMQLNLKADLAVLSACETGRGQIGGGEGMIGLSWAFFVAGVPTTVVSGWNVNSNSTSDLMVEFYQNLRQKPSKSEALQTAMISMLKNKRTNLPFYWAGFELIGKN